jgi:phosphate transport system substrate-binding protein
MMAVSADAAKYGGDAKFSYQPSSAREGQYYLETGRSHFIGTDRNLLAEVRARMPGAWLLPVMAQAVVVGFHLPDSLTISDLGLRIPREALAHIFLGRIVRWSELAQWNNVSINPQLASVHENISVVVRSDAAGVSEAFTSALSSFSAEWKTKVGTNSKPDWPRADFCVDGDAGVAKNIELHPFSLGFVSQAYAKLYGVKQAVLSNRAGEYVRPTREAVQAAMEEFAPSLFETAARKNFNFSIIDPIRNNSYPISMVAYFAFDEDKLRVSCNVLYDVLYLIHWAWTAYEAAEIAERASLSTIPVFVYQTMVADLRRRIFCNGKSTMQRVLEEKAPVCLPG